MKYQIMEKVCREDNTSEFVMIALADSAKRAVEISELLSEKHGIMCLVCVHGIVIYETQMKQEKRNKAVCKVDYSGYLPIYDRTGRLETGEEIRVDLKKGDLVECDKKGCLWFEGICVGKLCF